MAMHRSAKVAQLDLGRSLLSNTSARVRSISFGSSSSRGSLSQKSRKSWLLRHKSFNRMFLSRKTRKQWLVGCTELIKAHLSYIASKR